MAYVKAHGIRMALGGSFQNFVVENLTADPMENLVQGRMWFNSTDGVYKAVVDGSQTIRTFSTLKDLNDYKAIVAAQTTDDSGAAYVGYDGYSTGTTAFNLPASTIANAIDSLVAQVDTNTQDLIDLGDGSVTDLQNEVDLIEASVGLETDGSYVAPSGSNYIGSDAVMKDALVSLDTQIKANYDEALRLETDKLDRDGSQVMLGSLNMGNFKIINVATPTEGTDGATKAYVDSMAQGLSPRTPVQIASTGEIDIATGGLLTIDGVTLTGGERVLVKNQTNVAENGVYIAAAGAWSRSTDFDGTPENEVTKGAYFYVENGSNNEATGWVVTSDNPITIDTDSVEFAQFSSAGLVIAGTGLAKSGNILDINLGAGINEGPTDEVGIDFAPDGGVFTSNDGVSASTATDAQLYVKLADTSISRDISGIKLSTALQTEISTATSDIAALESELDATQVGAGLGTDGSYTVDTSSEMLSGATDLNNAVGILDDELQAVKDSEVASTYKETTTVAAITHTINHGLASEDIMVQVWVDNEGSWTQDIVSVSQQDTNNILIELTESKNIKVIIKKF